ncbi:hypothetical protein C8R46DRAFT_1227042 [Mycena filopes]|nr:hypothetical protein C8R46DRAFT_1227042 [Mycena filopes]
MPPPMCPQPLVEITTCLLNLAVATPTPVLQRHMRTPPRRGDLPPSPTFGLPHCALQVWDDAETTDNAWETA